MCSQACDVSCRARRRRQRMSGEKGLAHAQLDFCARSASWACRRSRLAERSKAARSPRQHLVHEVRKREKEREGERTKNLSRRLSRFDGGAASERQECELRISTHSHLGSSSGESASRFTRTRKGHTLPRRTQLNAMSGSSALALGPARVLCAATAPNVTKRPARRASARIDPSSVWTARNPTTMSPALSGSAARGFFCVRGDDVSGVLEERGEGEDAP